MQACDLDRSHIEQVKLDDVIYEPFQEQDPLFVMLVIKMMSEHFQYVKKGVEDGSERYEEKEWRKAHSLLEYAVREEENEQEAYKGAPIVVSVWPFQVLLIIVRVQIHYQHDVKSGGGDVEASKQTQVDNFSVAYYFVK